MSQLDIVLYGIMLACTIFYQCHSDQSIDIQQSKAIETVEKHDEIKKRAAVAVIAGASKIVNSMLGVGKFIYGIINGQQRLAELKKKNAKLDKLMRMIADLQKRVHSLQVGQQWLEGAILYGKDIKRIKYMLHRMNLKVQYCKSGRLKRHTAAKQWARAVLHSGSDGLNQILYNLHQMVMGTEQLFGRQSIITIYKKRLAQPSVTNPGTFTTEMETFVEYIMVLEAGGYAAIATAMNILGKSRQVPPLLNRARMHLKKQLEFVFRIVGVPAAWRRASIYTPPFHIAADGYRDLGARFIDLDGDKRDDLVYHRWINRHLQQRGAYLNNGRGWTWAPYYTPPFHVAADGYSDLGARFVDLNGDNKIDMVYNRWINRHTQQKGAYLNNGRGWTWAPHYTPPFPIAADGRDDLGTRFVHLNGDKKIDMVYHRLVNGNGQQKGAYLNNGNGWTWSPQYTPPVHIAANGNSDLGARFVDLNGDKKIDMVYHRWINGHVQQKGAYINNGNGWTWSSQYTPPIYISTNGHRDLRVWTWGSRYAFYAAKSLHGDLGVRFIDLNGDGKIDMVYHQWINQHTQKKGAYLNNGNGWTWSPQYTPPFHISANGYHDLGARFVEVNGDNKIDMVYHRWINGHTQQRGAYVNNGNGWTWAPQYTPPFHIAADGYGDLGARFIRLNNDGRKDMVFHRWINGKTQQKGAYMNFDFLGNHLKFGYTSPSHFPDC